MRPWQPPQHLIECTESTMEASDGQRSDAQQQGSEETEEGQAEGFGAGDGRRIRQAEPAGRIAFEEEIGRGGHPSLRAERSNPEAVTSRGLHALTRVCAWKSQRHDRWIASLRSQRRACFARNDGARRSV